jgi:predicted dithiol-disulfide oxidoreductase (DUF899 family)
MSLPKVVTRDEWLEARKELLANEKDLTRRRDALNVERSRLPMSTFARGAEMLGGSYYWLDLTALGRQEDWEEPTGRATSARAAGPDFAS